MSSVLFASLALNSIALGASPLAPSALGSPLQDAKLKGATVSAIVTDSSAKVLFSMNPDTRVILASNSKLFTGALAVLTFPKTGIPLDKITIEQKSDEVVVSGGGDPLTTASDWRSLADSSFKGKPIRFDSLYGGATAPGFGPRWQYGDLPNKYGAPVTAFAIDRNAWTLSVTAKDDVEDSALICALGGTDPLPEAGVKVNRILTDASSIATDFDIFESSIDVRGAVVKKTFKENFALPRPLATISSLLQGGSTADGSDSKTKVLLGSTLRQRLNAMMPPSDNFVAEGLWFRSAREIEPNGPMTFTRASTINNKRLRSWLGISPAALSLDDGSGLTRTNVSNARTIATLLRKMAAHPNQAIWRECMAKPGIGTLAGRLKGVDFIGKTGTLNMVVSLSGYVKRSNRSEVVVSVVVNHFSATPTEVRDLIDRFIANVAKLPL